MSEIYVHEPSTSGKVVLHTSLGDLDIELWSRECPVACRNFLQLCCDGYYDGLIFHRVIKDFIVQTGDPTGTGRGGSDTAVNEGKLFDLEIHPRLKFRYRGLVGVANLSGNVPAGQGGVGRLKGTNGNQFFITLNRCDALNNSHTLFGKVTGHSLYNLIKFNEVEIDKNDRPVSPPVIKSVEVVWLPFSDIQPRLLQQQQQSPDDSSSSSSKKTGEEDEEKKKKLQKKDKKLLSFAEEEEGTEDPEEGDAVAAATAKKKKRERGEESSRSNSSRDERAASVEKRGRGGTGSSSSRRILSAHDVLEDDPLLQRSSSSSRAAKEEERSKKRVTQTPAADDTGSCTSAEEEEEMSEKRERRKKRTRRSSSSSDAHSSDDRRHLTPSHARKNRGNSRSSSSSRSRSSSRSSREKRRSSRERRRSREEGSEDMSCSSKLTSRVVREKIAALAEAQELQSSRKKVVRHPPAAAAAALPAAAAGEGTERGEEEGPADEGERSRQRRRSSSKSVEEQREGRRKVEALRLWKGEGSASRGAIADKERLKDSDLMTEKEKRRELYVVRRRDVGRQKQQTETLKKLDAFTQQLRCLRDRESRSASGSSSSSSSLAAGGGDRSGAEARSSSSSSRGRDTAGEEKSKKRAEPGTLNAFLPDLDEEIDENDGSWLSGGGLKFAVDSNRAYDLDEARAAASVVVYDPLRGAGALAAKKMQQRRQQQAVGWREGRRDIEKW